MFDQKKLPTSKQIDDVRHGVSKELEAGLFEAWATTYSAEQDLIHVKSQAKHLIDKLESVMRQIDEGGLNVNLNSLGELQGSSVLFDTSIATLMAKLDYSIRPKLRELNVAEFVEEHLAAAK